MFSHKNTLIAKIFPILLLLLIAGVFFAPLATRAQGEPPPNDDPNAQSDQNPQLPFGGYTDTSPNTDTGINTDGSNTSDKLPTDNGSNTSDKSTTGGSNTSDKQTTTGSGNYSLPAPGPKTIPELISKIFNFLLSLAIPFAVLMIVFAGFKFVTAQGSEEKITQARKNLVWTIIGLAVILAAKIILGYIEDFLGIKPTGAFETFMTRVKGTLNSIIVLLFALATIYFIWGVIEYIKSGGEEEKLTQGKRHMVYGIIGMAVMASAWGIVAIVQNYIQ